MPPRPTISRSLYLPTVVPVRASAGIILLNVGSRLNERRGNNSSSKHACAILLFLDFSSPMVSRQTLGTSKATCVLPYANGRPACYICPHHAPRRSEARRTASHPDYP